MGKGYFIDDTSSEEEEEPEQSSPLSVAQNQKGELNEELLKAIDQERATYCDNNYWKNDDQYDVDALLDELD